jgi:branched-chain amino acid transport system substrate-binding protein
VGLVRSHHFEGDNTMKKSSLTSSTFVCSVVAAASLVLLGGCGKKKEENVIRIGHVSPTSGPNAHLGHDNEFGARLAIDELNAKGVVIGGKKVTLELLNEDDASDPKQGTAAAQKLIDAHVNGIIGHLNSGTTLPASKLYSEAGIPQVSPSATNPQYTRNGYKTAFRVVANDVHLGGTLGRYAVTDVKTIAVIDDRTAYGQGVAGEFVKAAEAAGGKVVSRQYTTDKATDLSSILTAIKAEKPDVIFFGGMDAVGGPMLRQMKQLAVDAKLMGGDGLCTTELPQLAGGPLVKGQVICAEAGGVEGQERVAMDDFNKRFKAKFNADVKLYAPYVYDAVNVMVAAMVKADSAEPAKYLPVLAATQGYKGVTGIISFDERGDVKNGALTLFTYNGTAREAIAVVR